MQTLVHMLSARRTLTEPEVRYFMHQLMEGCSYLHGLSIIHRDLKLANMLLAQDMSLKIADFGLATRIQFIGEKKRYLKFIRICSINQSKFNVRFLMRMMILGRHLTSMQQL